MMSHRGRFLEHLRSSEELLCPKCSNLLVEDGDGWYWCHRCEDDVLVGECRDCGGAPDQRVVNGMACERCADKEVMKEVSRVNEPR